MVKDSAKTCISVMFCGSASGEVLPPYVVYKGQNVYPSWTEGGIKGSVYSATKSGWFDMFTFEDWYFKIFLKTVKNRPGKKLLIGDNLGSHISPTVIKSCRENNIEFTCLPANATDKMQPLDVGIFGPMKSAWRKKLHEARDKDPSARLLNKHVFPRMLKELIEVLDMKKHLPAAFEKCGLAPFNPTKVLERIPSKENSRALNSSMDEVLLDRLATRRFSTLLIAILEKILMKIF